MGRTEWALLVALSVLWGGSFFFNAVVLDDLRPLTVVLGRVALAALVLNLVVAAGSRRMPRSLAAWWPFVVMGALNNVVPMGLITWGQTHIAAGLAAILNATTPLFTVVLAHVLTRDEKLTANRLGGVLLGLAGVALIVGLEALGGLGRDLAGQVAVLGAALSYGLANMFGRRFRGLPPLIPAAGQLTGSTVVVLPLALVVDRPWTFGNPSPSAWGALLGLALLSTALAYTIFFRILAVGGATNVSLVTLLIPVSALLLGALALGERPEPRALVGMSLIFAGLAAIDGRPLARVRRLWRGPVGSAP
jgi:drug/metabolite transporter (DMT)-like permease